MRLHWSWRLAISVFTASCIAQKSLLNGERTLQSMISTSQCTSGYDTLCPVLAQQHRVAAGYPSIPCIGANRGGEVPLPELSLPQHAATAPHIATAASSFCIHRRPRMDFSSYLQLTCSPGGNAAEFSNLTSHGELPSQLVSRSWYELHQQTWRGG